MENQLRPYLLSLLSRIKTREIIQNILPVAGFVRMGALGLRPNRGIILASIMV